MNYLAEIKLFNEWLETEQLPSNAIVLWYALMFTANRCGLARRIRGIVLRIAEPHETRPIDRLADA